MRVMLVEDNPGDVELVRQALRGRDVDLEWACDGEEALRLLRGQGESDESERPDLILMDLKMPRMGGLEVLERLKREPRLRTIPVVVLTSSQAPGDVNRAYELCAAACFSKPPEGFVGLLPTILEFVRRASPPTEVAEAVCERPGGPVAPRPEVPELRRARRLAAIVGSATDAIIGTDAQGTITSWNASATQLYGYEASEAIGRSVTILVPESRVEELLAAVEGAMKGVPARLRSSRVDGEGNEIHFELTLSPILDGAGTAIGASAIAREITDQVQAEARFRLAVEAAPSGIVMIDADGKIVLVNAETERMFRYDRGELLGRSIDVLVPARFRGQHGSHRETYVDAPSARAMGTGRELYGLRKDGTELPVEIGLNPIRSPDGLMILSTIVDITSRKRVEAELTRQREELARSNEELEQFAYVASHDLQEPLRMVSSYTSLLVEHLGDDLDEEARRFIGFAQDGAARMRHLIQDLLALSRVRTRGGEMRELDPTRLVGVALQNLTVQVHESAAAVEVAVDPAHRVRGDEVQLVTLLQNLVSNALKFHGDRPPRVRIESHRVGAFVRFTVRDEGIGIPPEYAVRIFQPFERLHTREEYPGTGIGLAICRRVVDRHGGEIGVESEGAGGACFFFTLPHSRRDSETRDTTRASD